MGRVSVIIPARNAGDTLRRTLACLAAQELDGEYEVIVVDNGSDDGTAAAAEAAPGPVSVIRQPNLGPAVARNRGAQAARGDVLAFTDADCFPISTWLAAGLRALERADLVQGAVRPEPAAAGPYDRSLWVVGDLGLYETANLFVRRSVFEEVGGFEPWLFPEMEHPFGEDVWFGWRARRSGARAAFSGDALVHHAVFSRRAGEMVAEHWRLRYFPAVARKVPELRRSMFYRRYFLTRRTAAFDAAVTGAAIAVATRSAVPLIGAMPYAWVVTRAAGRWRRRAPVVAAASVAADAVGLAALLSGSAGRRTLVL